jgi:putative transposase
MIGASEVMKEDRESWKNFLIELKGRGLKGDPESIPEVFPDANYHLCAVHFCRNIFLVTPRSRMKFVAKILKAIHIQESKESTREKAN